MRLNVKCIYTVQQRKTVHFGTAKTITRNCETVCFLKMCSVRGEQIVTIIILFIHYLLFIYECIHLFINVNISMKQYMHCFSIVINNNNKKGGGGVICIHPIVQYIHCPVSIQILYQIHFLQTGNNKEMVYCTRFCCIFVFTSSA